MTITSTYRMPNVLAGILLSIAVIFSFSVPSAQAQTVSELQAQINALIAQISALQAQLGGQSGSLSGACPYTWTRNLGIGSSGADVMKLQQLLNSNSDTRVAAVGAGSAGNETQYYGALTASAVSKFQNKYRAEVLTPLGLTNPTGYFGASSRVKANALCTVQQPSPSDPNNEEPGNETGDSGDTLRGFATLRTADLSEGRHTDLEEGQRDREIAELEIEFRNGDARISFIDLALVVEEGDEDDPWDVFRDVSLWVDGERIARINADDEDNYLNEDAGSLRFSGLDLIAEEEEELVISIRASVQNSVKLTGVEDSWRVDVLRMRHFDSDNVATNEDSHGDIGSGNGVSFDIKQEGSDDELHIRTSSENPYTTTFAVEENRNSDWHTILVFDLDTDDSVNDITIETAAIAVITPGSTYNAVVRDAELIIDGETFDDVTVTGGNTATATLSFDIDKDLEINAGDRVTAELRLQFQRQDGNYSEGQTIQATTSAAMGWEAEGADDLDASQLSGSAVGEIHVLRTSGVTVMPDDTSTRVQGSNATVGIFTIRFDLTAFESDFYVAANATTSNSSTDGGVKFTIQGPGSPTAVSAILDSTAEEDSDGVFTIREGETETFMLSVTVDPDVAGQYRTSLDKLYFTSSTDGTTNVIEHTMLPVSDYRTNYQYINAN